MIEAPNDIQEFGLGVPWKYDIATGGSRGFGKTVLDLFLAIRHAMAVPGSRSVFFRQTYGSLHDAVMLSVQLIQSIDPAASFNKSDLHWTFSNLSALTFAPLADVDQYRRWQGANITGCVIFDECQQWASPELPDLLLSNLRSTTGHTRAIYSMNPGDRGHAWLFNRFIKHAPQTMGEPFTTENGRETVLIRGTIADNPHLPKNYVENLRAATLHDPALFRAWTEGDWHAIGGTFFGDVFGSKNLVTLYPGDYWPERRDQWRLYISIDWGSSAPAVALLCAESRDSTRSSAGEHHVKGDTIILDELSTAIPGDLNRGDKSTVGEFSANVKKMLAEWEAPRRGCIDDAVYAQHGHERGPLANEFAENGLELEPAKKGRRVNGWSILKERLNNATQERVRERPGVYINRRCEYLIETLKMLSPDPRNREDCQTDGPDHAADALRMSLTFRLPERVTRTELFR